MSNIINYKNNKCFNNKCFNNICNKCIYLNNYCYNHFRLLYLKKIIIIQSYFRSYKTRRVIKNIYNKLPLDIQKYIKHFINMDLHYRRYYKKINNIVYNNTYKLFNINNNNIVNNQNKLNIDYIIRAYYLFNKYHKIMYMNDLKYCYILSEKIIDSFSFLYMPINYTLELNFNPTIYNSIDMINSNYTFFNLLSYINQYRYNYNKNYNIVDDYRSIII
jgi:hypothetical protein